MSNQDVISIYRIYNTSGDALSFETGQGLKISLPPGGAVDLYSFELEGSTSFAEIDDPNKIWKLPGQDLSSRGDSDSVDQLKKELLELRDFVSSDKVPKEIEPSNATDSSVTLSVEAKGTDGDFEVTEEIALDLPIDEPAAIESGEVLLESQEGAVAATDAASVVDEIEVKDKLPESAASTVIKQCQAMTKTGRRCKNRTQAGSSYCHIHQYLGDE